MAKALGERNATRGLRVVGITAHGDGEGGKDAVESVARDHGMTAPSFLDAAGAWSDAAGVRLDPTFLLLDRNGRVAYRYAGKLVADGEAVARMTELLDKM